MADMLSAGLRQRDLQVEEFLPYQRYADPSTIVLRSGAVMTMIALKGVAFETADASEVNALHRHLNTLLRNLADERLAIWTHVIRRRSQRYPEGTFRSAFARDLDTKYRASLLADDLFENELYMTLVLTPAAQAGSALSALFQLTKSAKGAGVEVDPDTLKVLADKVSETVAGLAAYGPRVLGLYDHNGTTFAEPSEVLHQLVGGRRERVPLTDGSVSAAIYSDRVIVGGETIEHRYENASRFSGLFAFKEYPAVTRPDILAGLLTVPFEIVLSQSFRFISKAASREIMGRKQNQMVSSGDRAVSQVGQLDDALDDLESNRIVMGQHTASLAVFADTVKELGDTMSAARVHMTNGGAVVVREDLALAATWLAQLPGNFKFRPRVSVITSRNFAGFSPFHGYPSGQPDKNAWGAAVAMLKTSSGSPYYFNFHQGDLGNTFICGPSGSGKTVALTFFMSQLQKHDPDIVFFDKDRGGELFIRAAGGTYLALRNGRPTGCAPLKALEFSPANRGFLERWIVSLVSSGQPLNALEHAEITFAIDAVGALPRDQRTIGALRGFLNTTDVLGIAARLARWERSGPLGWVFDNDDDHIGAAGRICGFDMTDMLDTAEVRTPLMGYLFHRFEERIDGRRIAIVVDEFWKLLGDEMFRDLAQNKLKTIRKQNGLMIFATQSPRDALLSPIAHTIIEQCPTHVFFPNERGTKADYCDGFKLTRKEFDLISRDLSKDSRRFLVKQGHDSVVAELNLGGFDDELAILSGRTANVEILEGILAEMGEGVPPEVWLPEFHKRRRVA